MDRTEYFLRDCFNIHFHYSSSSQYIIGDSPDGGSESIFGNILTADVKKCGLFEIPALIEGYVSNGISNCDTIYMPIGHTSGIMPKRSVSPILSSFDQQSTMLATINTSKGERYYGCRGLILNSEFKIIFITTVEGYINSDGDFKTVRYICRIPPRTFINTTGLLEKAIFKKFIPCLASLRIKIYYDSLHYEYKKPTIIIEDCDRFLIKPTVPTAIPNLNEALNDVVVNNINLIV